MTGQVGMTVCRQEGLLQTSGSEHRWLQRGGFSMFNCGNLLRLMVFNLTVHSFGENCLSIFLGVIDCVRYWACKGWGTMSVNGISVDC